MKCQLACVCFAVLIPGLTFGDDTSTYQCTFDGLQRRIEILSEPGVAVPCEVHYYKDKESPDEKQVLWRAESEAGYCEAKVDEFIVKLREWGWECVADAGLEE